MGVLLIPWAATGLSHLVRLEVPAGSLMQTLDKANQNNLSTMTSVRREDPIIVILGDDVTFVGLMQKRVGGGVSSTQKHSFLTLSVTEAQQAPEKL